MKGLMRFIILLLTFLLSLITAACNNNVETKPVKNNVLKEYIKTPLDKTKSMKAEVEAKQNQARDQLKNIDD